MLARSTIAELRGSVHDPPRILVCVQDEEPRAALVQALRDTGYDITQRTDPASDDDSYDLVLTDTPREAPGVAPTILLSEAFDVVEIEMLVLDVLGWDGPPTVRRMPVWAITG
jgi:hypothetical protein